MRNTPVTGSSTPPSRWDPYLQSSQHIMCYNVWKKSIENNCRWCQRPPESRSSSWWAVLTSLVSRREPCPPPWAPLPSCGSTSTRPVPTGPSSVKSSSNGLLERCQSPIFLLNTFATEINYMKNDNLPEKSLRREKISYVSGILMWPPQLGTIDLNFMIFATHHCVTDDLGRSSSRQSSNATGRPIFSVSKCLIFCFQSPSSYILVVQTLSLFTTFSLQVVTKFHIFFPS